MPTSSSSRPAKTVVRARSEHDLLAALPYLLGYHPVDSVVLIGMLDNRVGPTARVDIADVAIAARLRGGDLGRFMRTAGVHGIFVVVFGTDHTWWVDDFLAGLADSDLPIVAGWQLGADDFWPLGRPEHAEPLERLQSSVISAELVMAGLSPAAGRDRLLDELQPYPLGVRRRVARLGASLRPLSVDAVERALDVWAGWLGDPSCPPPAPSRGRSPLRPLRDRDTALLLAAVSDGMARDAMILSAVAPQPPREAAAWALTEDPSDVLSQWMTLGQAPRPDEDRLDAAICLLKHLVRAGTGAPAVTALAVLAELHWWSGDGALANVTVERALSLDPQHPLSGLIETLLSRGVPPPWVGSDLVLDPPA